MKYVVLTSREVVEDGDIHTVFSWDGKKLDTVSAATKYGVLTHGESNFLIGYFGKNGLEKVFEDGIELEIDLENVRYE